MTIAFSVATGAFYDLNTWPHELPDDAVEVSTEDHMAALDHLSQGGRIAGAANGHPVLADPLPMSVEVMSALARRRRDADVTAWRWMIERHRDELDLNRPTTLSASQFAALLTFIQALRDVPEQPGFPAAITWPLPPSDLSNTENT